MIRRFFTDYNNFICSADKCIDTCCGGWEIEIDEDSLDMYKELAVKDPIFNNNVNWEEASFNLKPDMDCSFHCDDGLCYIQRTYGEEYLCTTCDQYPRHIEEFPGVREYSLSVSCPDVAKALLSSTKSFSYEEVVDDIYEEDFEDFNRQLYDLLLEVRPSYIDILRDTSMSLNERFVKLVTKARNLQNSIDGNDDITESIVIKQAALDNSMQAIDRIFNIFFQLDPLDEAFFRDIEARLELVNPDSIARFDKACPESVYQLQQIACYFLYTYFCGAAYSEYVYSAARSAIFHTQMIKFLWVMNYERDASGFNEDSKAYYLYKYSRELENCNENLILLDQLIDENL